MKKILIFVFCLSPIFCLTQITKGVITYNVNMDLLRSEIERERASMNSQKYEYLSNTISASKDLEFSLTFDGEISVFKNIEGLNIGNTNHYRELALIMSQYKGEYFTNLNSRKQIILGLNNVNIESTIDQNDWLITQETKTIGKFKCFKAVLNVIVPKGETEIIAWYTPDLPMQLGPRDWVGQLPGLILELHDLAISYYATEINLKPKKNIEINWPDNAKTVTADEYKNKGDNLFNSLKKNN